MWYVCIYVTIFYYNSVKRAHVTQSFYFIFILVITLLAIVFHYLEYYFFLVNCESLGYVWQNFSLKPQMRAEVFK